MLDLPRLVALLRAGGVIACPTETLVGLLADARSEAAVAEVCRLKGRAPEQPIGVLIPDLAALDDLVLDLPTRARELAARYWPGPLTLVLRVQPGLPAALLREGKLAVRVPGPSPALDLVRAFGGPLTATSANRTGEPAASDDRQARAIFGDELAAIVPGVSPGGEASTIVDASGPELRVLRHGPIAIADGS